LGTTKATAGSQEKWVKIDREIPIAVANNAKNPSKDQKLVYLSAGGADAKSMFPYLQ